MKVLIKLISLTIMLLCIGGCSNDIIAPEQAYCSIEVGVVMDINGIDDSGYNELVWQGVTNYANSALLSTSCYKYFESSNEADYVQYLRSFADSVDIVIAASPVMEDSLAQVSKEYPRVTFAIVDTIVEGDNVVSLTYDENLLTFIAGRYAAYHVNDFETEKIAYIGDDTRMGAIFEQSALLVNENTTVEYEFNELHNYDNVVVAYNVLDTDLVEIPIVVTNNIVSSEHVIKKNITDDIYNIVREKARRILKMGIYNSSNVTLLYNDIDVARECKNIVNDRTFVYSELPTYMLNQDVVEEETIDNSEEISNEETVEE